jgi:hypothetical protein
MKTDGVGVMKDKDLNLEETESSYTLTGSGSPEGRVQGTGKGNRSDYVVWTDAPVCMCERGACGRG